MEEIEEIAVAVSGAMYFMKSRAAVMMGPQPEEGLIALAGFITAFFEEGSGVGIPYGFIFMNYFGGPFPGTAGFYNRLSQREFATTSRTTLGIEGIEFFKINDESLQFFF